MSNQKIIEFKKLQALRNRVPKGGLVHCHGVFDILHAGHLSYFQAAKKFGQALVVTLTADEFVNKGPGRPYFTGNVRAAMLAALEIVDFVSISPNPTAVPSIEALKPDFYVKGPDYKNMTTDITGAIYDERSAVERHGGRLVFTDDDTYSSSELINRFFQPWTDAQKKAIELVNCAGGLETIKKVLDKVSKESVQIIGEPIIDTYVFCVPENISSKSPSISARFEYEENYTGGSLAIANHLSDLVKDVKLYITYGGEKAFEQMLESKMKQGIQIIAHKLQNIPTPQKTRFITVDKSQRIFEVTNLRSDQWLHHSPANLCKIIKKNNKAAGTTILADFGHGLFEGELLETVSKLNGFVGLNVQTNSSNFGFNHFTKHDRFSYLSIDTKEARLASHDRFTPPIDLARGISKKIAAKKAQLGMTLGPNGACFFPGSGKKEIIVPAFVDNVIDATGAGDAFFALTSLLVKVGCPDVMVPFLGNVFAGLKTQIIGNKSAVPRSLLLKAVTSILK